MLLKVISKQAAIRIGAFEAWMVEDGDVTQGTTSSAFIVDKDGTVRTQPLGRHILPGVTRRSILRLAGEKGVRVEERPFSVAEALSGREAFMSAASAFVLPIIEIDGTKIGDGRPGKIAKLFRELYIEEAKKG
jgi:D-alanine transaminase